MSELVKPRSVCFHSDNGTRGWGEACGDPLILNLVIMLVSAHNNTMISKPLVAQIYRTMAHWRVSVLYLADHPTYADL